jgi:hypothetical protein
LEKLFSGAGAYLKLRDGNVIHTELGDKIYQILQKNKRKIASCQFSTDLEASLDDVEEGVSSPTEILQQFIGTYIDQEITGLEVDFDFKNNDEKQKEDSSSLNSIFKLIPEDHYLQGLKITSDDILSSRPEKDSNPFFKLRTLYEYFEISSIESLSERLNFDILFRWFVDLKMTDHIPSNEKLTDFVFSDQAISYKEASGVFEPTS